MTIIQSNSSSNRYNGAVDKLNIAEQAGNLAETGDINVSQKTIIAKGGVQTKFDSKDVEETKKMAALVNLVSAKISQELAAMGMAADKVTLTPPQSKKNVESAIHEVAQKAVTSPGLTSADVARGILKTEANLNPLQAEKLANQTLHFIKQSFNQLDEAAIDAEITKQSREFKMNPDQARSHVAAGLNIFNENPEYLKVETKGRAFYDNPFSTIFSALIQLALLVGRAASERNLQALQQNVEASQRRNDAITQQAKNEFSYAVAGAAFSMTFSIAGGVSGAKNAGQKYSLDKQHAHFLEGGSPVSNTGGYSRFYNSSEGSVPTMAEIQTHTAFRDMNIDRITKREAIVSSTTKTGEIFSNTLGGYGKVAGSVDQIDQNKAQGDSQAFTTSADEAKKAQNEAQQVAESMINQFRNNMNNRETMLNQMANR